MTEDLKPTSARDIRGKATFLHQVRPGLVVRIRRLTMTDMVLKRLIPYNLLKAAAKFDEIQAATAEALQLAASDAEKKAAEGKTVEDILKVLNSDELPQTFEFLKHYACVVVEEPKIVMEDDGNPDHLPVSDLTGDDLIGIYYAYPTTEEAPVSQEQAEDFRRDEPRPVADAVQPREDVREATQLVDSPEREYIHA